jgi:hypothetical protein
VPVSHAYNPCYSGGRNWEDPAWFSVSIGKTHISTDSWIGWYMSVIPTTWEAEIWRIVILNQPEEKVYKTPF